jgi:serine/threonine protein kinase
MVFLAFNHVVHADLACRNVLVFRFDENNPKNNIVKITDFGISRHSKLYSLVPSAAKTTLNIIPIRYVAPEIFSTSVTQDNYTEKSDVYSMGVLIWEAYSRGTTPWAKISDDNEVIRRVNNGEFLPKPSNGSELYWEIICKTWSKSPDDRPTFAQLQHLLTEQYYDTSPMSPNISMNLVLLNIMLSIRSCVIIKYIPVKTSIEFWFALEITFLCAHR